MTNRFLAHHQLESTAEEFGFNRHIPFEIPVEMSETALPEEDYEFARASTGLGNATLSPVHGALIAAAIVNDGKAYAPRIFPDGFFQKYKPFIQIPSATSQALSLMMRRTITHGTARRSFRGYQHRKELKKAFMGGKTGSLSSKTLQGDCDWFVGFAKE